MYITGASIYNNKVYLQQHRTKSIFSRFFFPFTDISILMLKFYTNLILKDTRSDDYWNYVQEKQAEENTC